MAPAGVAPGGIVLALPPPMYRQEAPRSKVFTEQAVSESIAPVNGMDAGLEKPAPPQLVVPAVVVYLSERPDGAQVVLVVLGAALLVVVVGAALDVVVVTAPVLVVVVGAERVVVVVVGTALLVVVVGAGHSDAIIEPQVPVVVTVPQVQVPALHALTTLFVQRLNTPPLNPDSPASSAQALRLHGDEGAAACPSEGEKLSQKRAATTVVVRITVPMTSSVLPRGQAPREFCSSANRRYQGDAD